MSWLSNILGGDSGNAEPDPVSNPPALPEDITGFEKVVGIKLPAALAAMYGQHNGVDEKNAKCSEIFRFMPLSEVTDTYESIAETGMAELAKRYGMVCFWTDDSSNYAGVFCSGIFQGRVFFLDHDGYYLGDLSPVFRSVESFQKCLAEAVARNKFVDAFEEGVIEEEELIEKVKPFTWYRYRDPMDTVDWYAFPVDYPSVDGKYSEADRVNYGQCRELLGSCNEEDERRFLIYSLARLVPPAERGELFPYLKEDDMWIPARLATLLVSVQEIEAIPHIVTLALKGNHNCRSGAQCALAKMILQAPGRQEAIKSEYSRQGGDYTRLADDFQRLERCPSLFYQW